MPSKCYIKPKYQPDLLALHRACSLNYLSLLKLLPNLDCGGYFFFHLDNACYQIHVIEQTQYTSVVSIETIANKISCGESVNELTPQIKVRLYHDAQMAEVLASRQIRYFKSSYDYPNRLMQQPDEKYQINKYLSEWLKHCCNDGRVMRINQGAS
ncbi:DUF1249 domain-containing protein [Psychrobium sp. 1_MG-2023]|uniref:DUF1249 domain-containing protein n=1 Tax=Psychrobium sp. 1_MG-2023 TaxID=3062624 RepID=UPI0026B45789|nr:DUF1249 domain-containing protein [Psychrobium sp. 1_MG-2023]MDP2561220.1 DUF1249 domain-containing protein [Psychrobium sp. 1_MG-2023]